MKLMIMIRKSQRKEKRKEVDRNLHLIPLVLHDHILILLHTLLIPEVDREVAKGGKVKLNTKYTIVLKNVDLHSKSK